MNSNFTYFFKNVKSYMYVTLRNCWISARGAIKLHPFGTSAGGRVLQRRVAISLPFKHLSSNCIISTLFYCLAICRAIFDTSAKRSEAHLLKRCKSIAASSTYPAIVLLLLYFYCLTIAQFLIQLLSEVRHTC